METTEGKNMPKRKGSKYEQKHRDQRRGKFRKTSPFSEPEKPPLFELRRKGNSRTARRVWSDLPKGFRNRRFTSYNEAVEALDRKHVTHELKPNSNEFKRFSFKYVSIVQ